MKEKILKLRGEGKNYAEIKEILGCSKGTISYHCGEGQKEKCRDRKRKARKNEWNKLKDKIDSFGRNKIRNYKRAIDDNRTIGCFDYASAYRKIVESGKCYLTGREIDFSIPSSYQLDHKVPICKGGDNTLKNMGLTCSAANIAKGLLSVEDFIELCVDVCRNNGYVVSVKK